MILGYKMADSDVKVNGDFVISQNELTFFCERNHISGLSLFGSVLGKDFGEESDIDVLVEFEPDHIPGYLGLARIEEEFSLLMGRKVDLNTSKSLSRYFRSEVIEQAENLYEKR